MVGRGVFGFLRIIFGFPMIKRTKLSLWHAPDVPLVGALLALLLFGVLMVYDSSVVVSFDLFGGQYRYLILQAIWAVLGLAVLLFFFFLDYRYLKRFALPFYILALVLLGLVLLPTPFTDPTFGAQRWFSFPSDLPLFGELNFQPSEFAKLALVLYLAVLFSERETGPPKKVGVLKFLIPTSIVVGLILAEPDFGTGVSVALIGLTVFFLAGGSLLQLLLLSPLVAVLGVAFVLSAPYRLQRILTFLNPSADLRGAGYQINQILIALGSGGLFGLGIGESRQKYGYIPSVSTDAVFAVIGEEFGFFGAVLVILLFAFIVYRGLEIARKAPDKFGEIVAAGITSWFGIQTIINLSSVSGLLPLTGIPLPLISYGGSSLVVLLAAFGILLNISRQTVGK